MSVAKRKDLPKQTVANAFLIRRVPITMAIEKGMLLKNVAEDIQKADEAGLFRFAEFSRRATPERTLKFLLQRKLLDEKGGLISRSDRTSRYVARLPKKVERLIDSLPVCDPLILLAGAGE